MQTTFGAPSGAFGGSKGDQSGTESLISTLMVPLNGSLTVSPFPQLVWIFGESGENLGLSLLELGVGDDAALLQIGELGELVGAALGARGVAHVLAELLVFCLGLAGAPFVHRAAPGDDIHQDAEERQDDDEN